MTPTEHGKRKTESAPPPARARRRAPLTLLAAALTLLENPTVTLDLEGDALSREAPTLATLRVDTPAQAILPADLRDRFRGFAVVEEFPAGDNAWRLRLTPAPQGPWRLMPIPLEIRDPRTRQPLAQTLTHAVTLPAPPPLPPADGAPECDPAPAWIPPGWRTLALWALPILLAAALLLAAIPLLRRLRRTLRERALSPEERAHLELGRLLAQGWVAQGRLKPFYYALTALLRRYFERARATRATRQTTQEFLDALAADPAFPPAARDALADFLAAADRVKYAGADATPAQAEAAADSARALIDADALARKTPTPPREAK